MNERDKHILEHIKTYCDDIGHAINRFGDDLTIFRNDMEYKHALAMCVLQIGELSVKLSDEFKDKTNGEYAPWTLIKGMRNRLVHGYGETDWEEIWETAHNDIPYLKTFCMSHIQQSDCNDMTNGIKIKRPPFDFAVSEEFSDLLNELVDAIESENTFRQALLEQEVWAARRELPEGSAEENWIMDYYYDRGWKVEE